MLKLTQESIDEIMAISENDITNNNVAPRIENPVYENGFGPINVTVIDPLNVKAGEYRLYFNMDTVTSITEASWILYLNGDSLTSSDRIQSK